MSEGWSDLCWIAEDWLCELEEIYGDEPSDEPEPPQAPTFRGDKYCWWPGMGYAPYLQTDRWQQIRKRAFEWYGRKCQVCHKHKWENVTLHIHHRSYEHLYNEVWHLEDLAVLCSDCHRKHHDGLIDIERLLPPRVPISHYPYADVRPYIPAVDCPKCGGLGFATVVKGDFSAAEKCDCWHEEKASPANDQAR